MSELLLELLSEEIPARMQHRALDDFCGLLRNGLVAADLPSSDLRGYVTPRRLAVIAHGVPAAQTERSEERRGPRFGAAPEAINGFLRAVGLGEIDECELRDTGRGQFYFAVVRRPGRPAAEVLPELIRAAVIDLSWPKSMRWPGSPLRWVRPLHSVICLFDGAVIPLALGVPVGRVTRGHRFLSPGELCIGNASEYLVKLQDGRVILDQDQRREAIRVALDRNARNRGVLVRHDSALLEEVSGLTEYPVVLAGAIDVDFMTLPSEVLQTTMRAHQKYFSCLNPDGSPAPCFLFVSNNLTDDGGTAIVAGNERVLRARLADARFFWDQDRKIRLDDRVEALRDRVYHEKLGSVLDKARRMEVLAGLLADQIDGADVARSRRAARLAKADLSTGMVGEFPELQGLIGRYYALGDGENARVADAIAEHYKPLGPDDTCPGAPDSIAVALADKIDALVSFFAIGEEPTGSRDPFALRRAALGVVRLIIENDLRFGLDPFLFRAEQLSARGPLVTGRVLMFIAERLKVHLRGKGVRHDLIGAAFWKSDSAGPDDDLLRILARAEALAAFLSSDDGASLLIAYRRASNIVVIERRRDGRDYDGPINRQLLRQSEERTLADRLDEASDRLEPWLGDERFEQAMAELSRLRHPVDEFFDKVTVNTDEPQLRENRLRLLSRIRATMNRVADFSQIEG